MSGPAREQVVHRALERLVSGDRARVHDKSRPGEPELVGGPRGDGAAECGQERVGIGLGQGRRKLRADLFNLIRPCAGEELLDNVEGLVDEKGVLRPVDRRGVEGRGVSEAQRDAVGGQAADGAAAVAQGVEHRLDREEDVVVLLRR